MKPLQYAPLRTASVLFVGLVGSILVVTSWMWSNGMLARDQRVDVIEKLQEPAEVAGWDERGLLLKDGRVVPLPECLKMPSKSEALSHLTKRGVEITGDGRVIGLVRVWNSNSCGTCYRGEYIVRVDIADALFFLKDGEWAVPPSERTNTFLESRSGTSNQITELGWETGSFRKFELVGELLADDRSRREPRN